MGIHSLSIFYWMKGAKDDVNQIHPWNAPRILLLPNVVEANWRRIWVLQWPMVAANKRVCLTICRQVWYQLTYPKGIEGLVDQDENSEPWIKSGCMGEPSPAQNALLASHYMKLVRKCGLHFTKSFFLILPTWSNPFWALKRILERNHTIVMVEGLV